MRKIPFSGAAIFQRLMGKEGKKLGTVQSAKSIGCDEWLVGAHLSAAKGPHNAIKTSVEIGANAVGLFLKNQRTWNCPSIPAQHVEQFKKICIENSIDPMRQILPHGSYLVNLGNPDGEKREKSFVGFLDDLKRCELLGIGLYNLHPGSTVGQCTTKESIQYIAEGINRAHKETSFVTIVVENMAGQKNLIGSRFEDLANIIDLVIDKQRIGICLDTCHLFGAGYDIRRGSSFQQVLEEFDRIVGLNYLKGMHLNDSYGTLGSHKDRHANIGKGEIGLEAFRFIMNNPQLKGIPLILETPVKPEIGDVETYKKEIELLKSLYQTNN